MLLLFLQKVLQDADGSVRWIGSVSSLLALVLSLISIGAILVGYGRWLEKLNGVGGRVKELEIGAAEAKKEREQFKQQIDRTLNQLETLIEKIGEHGRSTIACREDTERLGIDLGSKIMEGVHEIHETRLELSTRLTRVETQVSALLEQRRT